METETSFRSFFGKMSFFGMTYVAGENFENFFEYCSLYDKQASVCGLRPLGKLNSPSIKFESFQVFPNVIGANFFSQEIRD